jgi:hypothetical protein
MLDQGLEVVTVKTVSRQDGECQANENQYQSNTRRFLSSRSYLFPLVETAIHLERRQALRVRGSRNGLSDSSGTFARHAFNIIVL